MPAPPPSILLLIYPTDSAPGPFPGWSFGWSTKQIYCLGLNPAAAKSVQASRFWVVFENYKNVNHCGFFLANVDDQVRLAVTSDGILQNTSRASAMYLQST